MSGTPSGTGNGGLPAVVALEDLIRPVDPNAEVEVRELQPEELYLLSTVPPFNTDGIPDFRHAGVAVVQEKESRRVVGYWMLFDTIHVEPLWLHPDYRKRSGVLRKLWGKVADMLGRTETKRAFAIIQNDDEAEALREQAKRLGFQRMTGDLYFVNLK